VKPSEKKTLATLLNIKYQTDIADFAKNAKNQVTHDPIQELFPIRGLGATNTIVN
jgi:hypothetical protein